jgi:hypothetical protein
VTGGADENHEKPQNNRSVLSIFRFEVKPPKRVVKVPTSRTLHATPPPPPTP